ncbi:hypothetical protein T439DRAFT_347991 [Meredithblackwellia eburnea MCA 4105]
MNATTLQRVLSNPLHCALATLLSQTLEKVFQQLSSRLPLVFNPSWIDRLSTDLESHSIIASSLIKILQTSQNKQIASKYDLLSFQLRDLLKRYYPASISDEASYESMYHLLLLQASKSLPPDRLTFRSTHIGLKDNEEGIAEFPTDEEEVGDDLKEIESGEPTTEPDNNALTIGWLRASTSEDEREEEEESEMAQIDFESEGEEFDPLMWDDEDGETLQDETMMGGMDGGDWFREFEESGADARSGGGS